VTVHSISTQTGGRSIECTVTEIPCHRNTFGAIATSGPQRIKVYKPIDQADRIDDWLYLPEILYAFMLIMVVSAGAGPYSLDALILDLIDNRGA
jgi:hypothetical protein